MGPRDLSRSPRWRASLLLLGLGLGACNRGERIPYYDGTPPTLSGLSGDAFEAGNLGGHEITITGSGLGSDPNDVVVQFGSLNATIVSVSDTEVTVITPAGPIEGGLVDVHVGTASGKTTLPDAYDYQVDEVYTDQTGYILVNNYWHSCYGGGDDLGAGCSEITYLGDAGTTGSAAFYNFLFPRVHTGDYGWGGGTDVSPGTWSVQTPAYRPFASAIEDLRQVVPEFELYNPLLEGETWCTDLTALGGWYYGGNDELDPVTVSPGEIMDQGDCADPNARSYDLSRLPFCETDEYQQSHTGSYEADWPVGRPFFIAHGEDSNNNPFDAVSNCRDDEDNDDDGLSDGQDPDCHPTVELLSEGMGLNKLALTLPEPVRFRVTEGVTPGDELYQDIWAVFQGFEECFDDDGNGNDDADETAVRIEWEPSAVAYTSEGRVKGAATHVRISLSVISLGWFGGDTQPYRATITVPDDWNYDEETGTSMVEIPISVMQQIPDVTFNYGSCVEDPISGKEKCTPGDPLGVGYGYLILTADRVTEYRIETLDPDKDVVFAYATGDFTFLDWDNPLNKGSCDNCLDDDGDGWAESLDADCLLGEAEDGSLDGTELYTCSDGVDNDGDGDIDIEDADCESGIDRESNCGDRADNDGDGWTDDEDGECLDPNGQEFGDDDPSWTCSDGLDNDSDGWIDGQDLACVNGADIEDDGFVGNACNDGIDNDGHQDIDASDPLCFVKGAAYELEEPEYVEECVDGEDNESKDDGYIDSFDPDCEYSPYWKEGSNSHSLDSKPATKQCYDGLDNDSDGLEDSQDPGCWNADLGYKPDGFLNDESDDGDCIDGVDNDEDGFIDLLDPGCAPGVGRDEAGG